MKVAVRRGAVILGFVLVAAGCSSGSSDDDAVTTTSAGGITTQTSTATPEESTTPTTGFVLDSGWEKANLDPTIFNDPEGSAMHWVTAGGPGFVAVGIDDAQTDVNAAVWTSTDSINWTRVADPDGIFGGPSRQVMTAVTAGGPGLVAVGFEGAPGEEQAAIWTSVDGPDWSRVPPDETIFGGEGLQAISSVTAGGPGLVAVGLDESAGDQGAAAVWTSVDGLSWTRVPHDDDALGGPGEQSMSSVTAGGPGLVAVGADRGAGTGDASAVWTSEDGLSWSRVPHDATIFENINGQVVMFSVVAGGPGLVAVGADSGVSSGTAAAVWTSPDGFEWTRVPHVGSVFGGGSTTQMLSVSAGDSGLVASGFDRSDTDPREADAVVWTSEDGLQWARLPRDSATFGGQGFQSMLSVVVEGERAVGVGADLSVTGLGGAVWTFEG
ncbi:MAG: hypothetical protein ACC652_07680 [Acidimicrobiales bacterium]